MPPPRRAHELLTHYVDLDFRESFVKCWAVSELLSQCLLPDQWEVPADLTSAISLTAEGKDWAAWCSSAGIPYDLAQAVVFTAFARESLFVDVASTDVDDLLRSVSNLLFNGEIRIANAFGREPDDVFGRDISEWRESLNRHETRRFLSQTSQGIAQFGKVIFGPMGVLTSAQDRVLALSRTGASFYCDDPGCGALHGVELITGDSEPALALQKLADKLAQDGRMYSEWPVFFRSILFPRRLWEWDRLSAGLPGLLANAFAAEERRLILSLVLRSSGTIRQAFSENHLVTHYATKHADEVLPDLSDQEVLQSLLAESDAKLVEVIELAVADGQLHLPPTEIRISPFSRTYLAAGLFECQAQLSTLGVRFVGRPGLMQLRTFVRELYESEDELEWKLRHVAGASPGERLGAFLLRENPAAVLRTLVFDSPTRLRKALELVGPGAYPSSPVGLEAEEQLIRTLLWKLGFTVDVHPEYLRRLHQRAGKFAGSVDSFEAIAVVESEREEIRGAGSNLFVALEEVLDATLAFTSWALTFDHFGARRDRFTYSLSDARTIGIGYVNSFTVEGGVDPLDPRGVNTLGPLTAGFAHLADALEQAEHEAALYLRADADFPQWAKESQVEVFPFRHTLPWLDLTQESRERLLALIKSTPAALTRTDVAKVRNQTTHRRDDFPSGVEITRVCDALELLVTDLEIAGLAPNVFTLQATRSDVHGRRVATLVDYVGRTIDLPVPSEIGRCEVPSIAAPQAVLRAAVIQGTSDLLRFRVREDSPYRELWRGWPVIVQAPARQPQKDGGRDRIAKPERVATPEGADV